MDVKTDLKIPLRRSSHDFCFYGRKGSGKTIAMSYFGLYFLLQGYKIYSNYHLVYPHFFVNNLDDLENIHDGVFLGDDFEAWGSSKFVTNKEKARLLECTLNFGKRNIDFMWSCKRPLEIDKTLRACVDYFVKCQLMLKYEPKSIDDYDYYSGFLDAHDLVLEVYDANDLQLDRLVYLNDLDVWCSLYSTTEQVSSPAQFKQTAKDEAEG